MKNEISMEQIIKEVEKEVRLICSTTGKAYLKTTDENNVTKLLAVDSDSFEHWFRSYCYSKYGMILSSGGHIQAQAHMRMLAKRDSKRYQINKRVYAKENAVYYDLGRTDGKYLKITPKEIKTVKNPNILFLHSNIFAPQVQPVTDNVVPEDIRGLVEKHFNFRSESDILLFSTFLISCFFGRLYPQSILEVFGQKASSKSTCLKRVQDLIDPHTVNPLFAMPRKENDVAMCLSSDYLICFDNISYISQNISDLLCRNCTGSVYVKRKLFTDNTQALSEPSAIVCFNSTRQCIVRSDLADRAIFLELERINPENMQSENELQKSWKKDLPCFFGALCLAVKGVLADKKPMELASPIRLVDFYSLAVKAGRQIGYTEQEVHHAFCENRKRINEAVVSENVLLTIIDNFMNKKENIDGIKAQVTKFYRELKMFALEECGIDGRSFPGAPEVMTRRMSENRSNLEDTGIYFEIKRGKNARYIEIWKQ